MSFYETSVSFINAMIDLLNESQLTSCYFKIVLVQIYEYLKINEGQRLTALVVMVPWIAL